MLNGTGNLIFPLNIFLAESMAVHHDQANRKYAPPSFNPPHYFLNYLSLDRECRNPLQHARLSG